MIVNKMLKTLLKKYLNIVYNEYGRFNKRYRLVNIIVNLKIIVV